jgi:hypothetical protein
MVSPRHWFATAKEPFPPLKRWLRREDGAKIKVLTETSKEKKKKMKKCKKMLGLHAHFLFEPFFT